MDAVVVFDGGSTDERRVAERCAVVGSGGETADEAIERRAKALAADGRPYWLITSDRALRAAAGGAADRTIGGGAFVKEIDPA